MITSLLITAPKEHQRSAALALIPFARPEHNPDVLWIGQDEGLGIDVIRRAVAQLQKKPYQEAYQIAVLLDADSMTPEAQNAFLKTLEEPPERTQIILAAANPYALLPTIRSRCIEVKPADMRESSQVSSELPPTLAEAFAKAEQLAGDRQQAVAYCDMLLRAEFRALTQNPTANKLARVNVITRVLRDLKRNINIRLAMEHLFFTLAKPEYFV